MKLRQSVLFLTIAMVVFLPSVAFGQGFVPCDGTNVECNACHFVEIASRLVRYLVLAMALYAVYAVVITAFKLLTSGGNTSALNETKNMFKSIVIGVLIVLFAWIGIDTIMKTLLPEGELAVLGNDFGPWNEIQCVTVNVQVEGVYDRDVAGAIVLGGGAGIPVARETGEQICFPGDGAGEVCVDKLEVPNDGDYAYKDASHLGYARPGYFIDLKSLNPDTKLSPNFTVGEIAQLYKGDYAFIDPALVSNLENVRSTLGSEVVVNSGYRSPGYNSKLEGSAEHSRHQYGDAVDLDIRPGQTAAGIEASCKANGATFTKRYSGHVHCDWR